MSASGPSGPLVFSSVRLYMYIRWSKDLPLLNGSFESLTAYNLAEK